MFVYAGDSVTFPGIVLTSHEKQLTTPVNCPKDISDGLPVTARRRVASDCQGFHILKLELKDTRTYLPACPGLWGRAGLGRDSGPTHPSWGATEGSFESPV